MKCLKLTGTASLVDKFIFNFSNALQDKQICVISEGEAGNCEVAFPGQSSAFRIMRSMPPDIVLIRSGIELAAPAVHCGSGTINDEALVLSRYNGEESGIDYQDIYRKVFNLLPQKTVDECGRCGLDCRRFAEAILRGEKSENECFYASGSVEVKLGGRLIELGEFPSSIIEGAVIGLVSSLRGYREKEDISIIVKS